MQTKKKQMKNVSKNEKITQIGQTKEQKREDTSKRLEKRKKAQNQNIN